MTSDDIATRYSRWLASAMRAAGLDIDRQRGGGRGALAQAVGVSPSSVGRWLDGKAVPSPELFEPIADAVGADVRTMLVESGIISPESLTKTSQFGVRSQAQTPAQAADALGIHDPVARAQFMRDMAVRSRRHLHAAESPGSEPGGAVAQ